MLRGTRVRGALDLPTRNSPDRDWSRLLVALDGRLLPTAGQLPMFYSGLVSGVK